MAEPRQSLADRSLSRRDFGVLAFLLFLSLVVRWPAMGTSLWIDELHTSWVVADGWQDVIPRAREGNQSPVYFLMLRGWITVVGISEFTLRFPSLIAGIAVVLGTSRLARRWTGSVWLGLLAGLLVATDSRFIFYSTEARPYALLQLAALWHVQAACDRREQTVLISRLALILSGAALFHLHYTGTLIWGAAAAIRALPTGERTPGAQTAQGAGNYVRRLVTILADYTVVLLLCSPALPHVLAILQRREAWNSFVEAEPHWTSIFTTLHAMHFVALPFVVVLLLFVVAWLQTIFRGSVAARWQRGAWWRRRGGATPESPDTRYREPDRRGFRAIDLAESRAVPRRDVWQRCYEMACWWLVPLFVAWIATRLDLARIFFPRYLVGVAAAPIVLGTLGTYLISPRSLRVACAVGLVMVALVSDGYVAGLLQGNPRPLRHENWRALVATLREQPSTDAPLLLLRSGLIEADGLVSRELSAAESRQLRAYCQYAFRGIYPLDPAEWIVEPLANQAPMGITPSIRNHAVREGQVWLAIRTARRRIPEVTAGILNELIGPDGTWRVERQWSFGNVQLVLAQRADAEHSDHGN